MRRPGAPFPWRDLPALGLLVAGLALYLAPTKDAVATVLLAAVGAWTLLTRPLPASPWRPIGFLWPLAALAVYAALLTSVFPGARAEPMARQVLLGALGFWVFFHRVAVLPARWRVLWVGALCAVPALAHLLVMAVDVAVWIADQEVLYIELLKDAPRVGRRYLSHAPIPLLMATLLLGARVRPAWLLPAVFAGGLAAPLLALALLDARAAYAAGAGLVLLIALVRPLRRACGRGWRRWRWRLPACRRLLAYVLLAAVAVGYTTGLPRWVAMADSFSGALEDVRAWGGGAAARPPFADTHYWGRSVKERCADNLARCEVDQSMYLRTAWFAYAARELLDHPWGQGLRPDLLPVTADADEGGAPTTQNTVGDNFLIEVALAYGAVGLALVAMFWWRILRLGVAGARLERLPLQALLSACVAIMMLRSLVDVLSFGLWYYAMAMTGLLLACAQPDSPRLPASSTNAGSMLKRLLKRLLRGRYHGLNGLDRKMEAYVGYDGGYFVELGANDGVSQSNTLYFEKYRHWKGLLVEPAPHKYQLCRANRSPDTVVQCAACVSFGYREEFVRIAYSNLMSAPLGLDSDIADPRAHARSGQAFLGQAEQVIEYGAVARTLQDLLREAGAPATIDFLSLDVEGAELEVLQGVDHAAYRFKFILVECRDFDRMRDFLVPAGYTFVEKLSEHDYLFRSAR